MALNDGLTGPELLTDPPGRATWLIGKPDALCVLSLRAVAFGVSRGQGNISLQAATVALLYVSIAHDIPSGGMMSKDACHLSC